MPLLLALLIDLWRLALPVEELFVSPPNWAPTCRCASRPRSIVSGRRDWNPLNAASCAILLVNPGAALPTPEVFAAVAANSQ